MPFDKYEKDFRFIINVKENKTSRFVADLLSPFVREYLLYEEYPFKSPLI